MPVPKSKEKKYGLIVGHLQNLGEPLATAKKKTDEALGLTKTSKKRKAKKPIKPKGKRNEHHTVYWGKTHSCRSY